MEKVTLLFFVFLQVHVQKIAVFLFFAFLSAEVFNSFCVYFSKERIRE